MALMRFLFAVSVSPAEENTLSLGTDDACIGMWSTATAKIVGCVDSLIYSSFACHKISFTKQMNTEYARPNI